MRNLSLTAVLFPVNLREALNLATDICKICDFSYEIFLSHPDSAEKIVSPHSAGIGEHFFSPLSGENVFQRLKDFFTAFNALDANFTFFLKFTANLTSFSDLYW